MSMSAIQEVSISENARQRLEELAERLGFPLEDVAAKFTQCLGLDFVRSDPQFKTDEDREEYCYRYAYVKLASQPPTKEYEVIPIGHGGLRITRSGVAMDRVYALIKAGDRLEKAIIIFRNETVDLVGQIQFFSLYRLQLASWRSDTLLAVASTRFDEPKLIGIDPVTLLKRFVGAQVVRIADSPRMLSRMEGSYVDDWDLRLLRAIVVDYNHGERANGTKWAVYTVSDDSVGREDQVTEDGKVIPTRFTVWVPYNFLRWNVDSELWFVGTVQLDSDNVPFMNAISVIPVHGIPLEVAS